MINDIFLDFLIEAQKSTYANSTIEKVASSRVGSSDYNYEEIIDNKKYIYHDTYFGGTKFMGEEIEISLTLKISSSREFRKRCFASTLPNIKVYLQNIVSALLF